MPEPAPIEFTQGEYVDITLFLTDGSGAVLDITDCTFEAQIRDITDLDVCLATFTCTPDVPTGAVLLELSSAASADIPSTVQFNSKGVETTVPERLLFYDCFKVVDTSRKLIAAGPVKVRPAITRS